MSFRLDVTTHSLIAPRILLRIADNRTITYPSNNGTAIDPAVIPPPDSPTVGSAIGGWLVQDWDGAPLTSNPTFVDHFDSLDEAVAAA